MLSHSIPQGPRKSISQDLFKQGGRWYSVTVDHYSDWFEVDLLNEDITAANVVSATKAHCPLWYNRYILSDNRPQYTSQEFLNFAKTHGFKLTTRSPYSAGATFADSDITELISTTIPQIEGRLAWYLVFHGFSFVPFVDGQ